MRFGASDESLPHDMTDATGGVETALHIRDAHLSGTGVDVE
jgi:hypothetical protein